MLKRSFWRNQTRYRLGWLSLFSFLLGISASAQTNPDAAFAQGNKAFQATDYEAALRAYEQAEKSGLRSPALYHNMGNAYYREGKIGYAVQYYERALALDPYFEHAQHSLRLAQKKINNPVPALPQTGFHLAWRWIRYTIGAWGLFALGFLAFAAVVGLLGHWIWLKGEVPWRRRALMLSSPLALLFLGSAWLASYQSSQTSRAVIVSKTTDLHAMPSDQSAKLRTLSEGVVVELQKTQNGWQEVRLPNGDLGWIRPTSIGII